MREVQGSGGMRDRDGNTYYFCHRTRSSTITAEAKELCRTATVSAALVSFPLNRTILTGSFLFPCSFQTPPVSGAVWSRSQS